MFDINIAVVTTPEFAPAYGDTVAVQTRKSKDINLVQKISEAVQGVDGALVVAALGQKQIGGKHGLSLGERGLRLRKIDRVLEDEEPTRPFTEVFAVLIRDVAQVIEALFHTTLGEQDDHVSIANVMRADFAIR